MILVLCANAGVDKTYEAPGFAVGGFHHPLSARTVAGGKGINVARALRNLGHEVTLTGFVGGYTADFVVGDVRGTGAEAAFVSVAGDSRLSINIIDPTTGVSTRLDENGPEVSADEVGALQAQWEALLPACELAIISGSAPPGTPLDLYRHLVERARKADRPFILDAHDELLAEGIKAGPSAIKPNLEELECLVGHKLPRVDDAVAAARALAAGGIELVIVSLDRRGAIAVTPGGEAWLAEPPDLNVVNTVGAGDAMVAGLADAMIACHSPAEQLARAVAAGSASVTGLAAGLFERIVAEALLPGIRVTEIAEDDAPR